MAGDVSSISQFPLAANDLSLTLSWYVRRRRQIGRGGRRSVTQARTQPRSRPHRHLAVGSALARELREVAIPPAPNPEASQDRGQGRATRVAARSLPGPWTASLVENSAAPIEGMAAPSAEPDELLVITGRDATYPWRRQFCQHYPVVG